MIDPPAPGSTEEDLFPPASGPSLLDEVNQVLERIEEVCMCERIPIVSFGCDTVCALLLLGQQQTFWDKALAGWVPILKRNGVFGSNLLSDLVLFTRTFTNGMTI